MVIMEWNTFSLKVEEELRKNILPFWMNVVCDHKQGGFYGFVDADGKPSLDAPKGGILTARILWTFSHAYRLFGDEDYLNAATHAYRFLSEHLWDIEFGGIYWLVSAQGEILDPKKQIYAQGFSIYGLSEYYLATKDTDALDKAIRVFELVEEHAFDSQFGGYFEACNRDWALAENFSLSPKEGNDPKTMNTHLHILEPYTNLLRSWDNGHLYSQQRGLIHVFLDHIIDPQTHHFQLFFDKSWQPRDKAISYGHDIEGTWLLVEAAEILGDDFLSARVTSEVLKMADTVYNEALQGNGALVGEISSDGKVHGLTEWWTFSEAVVGFLNAYQLSGSLRYMQAAMKVWQFIEEHFVDHQHGEWYRAADLQGRSVSTPLVDFWKCPYHNGRTCMEVYERLHSMS